MKKNGLLIVLLISLISCSKDDASPNSVYYGKWMEVPDPAANSIPGFEVYYVFKKDKKFVKTIPSTNGNKSLSGQYEIIKNETGTSFVLTYPSANESISNCTSGALIENYKLQETDYLVDQASACGRYKAFKKAK
ncbi:hypothetical protein [Flavobacterium chungbukense]|uniref:Lipocalin-like domain-containing protein n=1 Tax=Flavobacterium chungbukense TaxID=877464 RepID=A0ABP7YUG5_9FLAO|nr:hypothetical protein [Flavobacterium chungbukense]MCC4923167.1 hypothetical protein [Flavobacterium chungbukense]